MDFYFSNNLIFNLEAGDNKQDFGEPDASVFWDHICFSGSSSHNLGILYNSESGC